MNTEDVVSPVVCPLYSQPNKTRLNASESEVSSNILISNIFIFNFSQVKKIIFFAERNYNLPALTSTIVKPMECTPIAHRT